MIEQAARFEIPVMAEPIALRLPKGEQSAELEAHAARVATELGADIIKIAYPGRPDLLRPLKDELHLPVVILGGPTHSTADGLIRLVAEAVSAGANGIVIGRQVWQREPAERLAVIRVLIDVVHRRLTAGQAAGQLSPVARHDWRRRCPVRGGHRYHALQDGAGDPGRLGAALPTSR